MYGILEADMESDHANFWDNYAMYELFLTRAGRRCTAVTARSSRPKCELARHDWKSLAGSSWKGSEKKVSLDRQEIWDG